MRDITEPWRAFGETDEVAGPLAEVVRRSDLRFTGLAGPPGGGKSTLAREVVDELGPQSVVVSLDDFYLSKRDRAARGLRWRGPPGSHDVDALVEVLDAIRAGRGPIILPRFSADLDDRIEPVTIETVPRHVLVEGWVLGYREDGYGEILERLDLLAFLDVPIETARARRFSREAELRTKGGGFSERDTQRFWDEVLEPGLDRWVRDAREAAELNIDLDDAGELRTVTTSSPAVIAALSVPPAIR